MEEGTSKWAQYQITRWNKCGAKVDKERDIFSSVQNISEKEQR